MNKYFLATLFAVLFSTMSFAQDKGHSDIEFGFEDPAAATPVFEIELFEETTEGILVAEGEFNGPANFRTADSPGFITPVDEGLVVNAGDQVSVRVLDASAAGSPTNLASGYVSFWTPTGGFQSFDSSFGTLTITGNTPGSTADTLTVLESASVVSGPTDIFLAEGSDGTFMSDVPPSLNEDNVVLGSGEIHNHLAFDLSGSLSSTPGAIGMLVQFSAVLDSNGQTVDSDPFFLIFNNGLPDSVFEEEAVLAFGLIEEDEVLLGDINMDESVDFLDIQPFIDLLTNQTFQAEGDFDGNNEVDFFDIQGFIDALSQ